MRSLQDIANTFSILHDGTVEEWSGNYNMLELKVSCGYLAEKIESSFQYFYLQLFGIEQITFDAWLEDTQNSKKMLTELADIFEAELEILSAEVKSDSVVVTFNQADSKFDYCGGNLFLVCKEVKVFDQAHKRLSLAQLKSTGEAYWAEWAEENKKSK